MKFLKVINLFSDSLNNECLLVYVLVISYTTEYGMETIKVTSSSLIHFATCIFDEGTVRACVIQ